MRNNWANLEGRMQDIWLGLFTSKYFTKEKYKNYSILKENINNNNN
jgi:hypothetical protein